MMAGKLGLSLCVLAVCLWSAAARAQQSVDAFGLTNTTVGNASLSTSGSTIDVGPLSSGGQDGLSPENQKETTLPSCGE